MIDIRQLIVRAGSFTLGPIDISVPRGSYAVLMGASGSGKTTLLEALCGLRRVLRGSIRLEGRDLTAASPMVRGIGYVPQDGALFPTMKVSEHLAFPLRLRRWSQGHIQQHVALLAAQLEISPLLERYPAGLSGGERQRVALGRALCASPAILCLDEPLSALDAESHARLCNLLRTLHRELDITVLHITHNAHEADSLATCVFTLDTTISSVETVTDTPPSVRLLRPI